MELCNQNKNYAHGMKWESMSNVLISIGVKQHIEWIASKRAERKKIRNDLKKASRNALLGSAPDNSDSVELSTSNTNHSNTNNMNLSYPNLSATEIIDLDGKIVETNGSLLIAYKGDRGGSSCVRKHASKL